VIKIGSKFPIAIWMDPVKSFRPTLAKRQAHAKTRRVTKVQLGDEGYWIDQGTEHVYLFREGARSYEVLISRLITLSPAKRLAFAKATARKASGAPSPTVP
jgi:hypothetical protein